MLLGQNVLQSFQVNVTKFGRDAYITCLTFSSAHPPRNQTSKKKSETQLFDSFPTELGLSLGPSCEGQLRLHWGPRLTLEHCFGKQ